MGALLISLMLGAAAPAAGTETLARFEREMAGRDYPAATRVALDLALAGPPPAGNRPDPVVSGLLGRLLARAGLHTGALAYLEQADSDAVPAVQRVAALFALADAREAVGDRTGAAETYRRLGGLALSPAERRRAGLALARLQLVDAPQQALRGAAAIAAEAGREERWEADLLAAEATLLAGDAGAAAAAADRAWSESAEAPAEAAAPLRVALLRAAIAERTGRRDALLGNLFTAGAAGKRIKGELADLLPVCGTGGLGAEDWVELEAFNGADGRERLTPVAASRPGAVAPLLDAVAGAPLFTDDTGDSPGGTLVTLRCRTAPSSRYDPPNRGPDPWAAWFARRGLPLTISSGELNEINHLSERIEQLALAHPDDPRLIPLRVTLATALQERAKAANDVPAWQIARLIEQSRAGLRKAGDADGLLLDLGEPPEDPVKAAADPAAAMARLLAEMSDFAARAPLDIAYRDTFDIAKFDPPLPLAFRRAWIETLLKRFADRPQDKRRTALTMMLAGVQREEDARAARTTWRAAGLAPDLCEGADAEPSITEHHIDDSDFPRDNIPFMIPGITAADFSVTAEGKSAARRIILSSPSGLFDGVLMEKLAGFELKPAEVDGRPRLCRGATQRVQWKGPEPGERRLPSFADPEPGSTS